MTDREIIRELAKQYKEISASDAQKKLAAEWGRFYALDHSIAPKIMVDQIPFGEFMDHEELQCKCQDGYMRGVENYFRIELFRYNNFGGDMVLPDFFPLSKSCVETDVGINTQVQDESEHKGASTHLYRDQIPDMDAVNRLKYKTVKAKPEETKANKERLEELMGDIIDIRPMGKMLWNAIWDRIVFWRGAEPVLYDLIDNPDLLHATMKKLVDIEMDYIDQLERENLLAAGPGCRCHCTETYTDEEKWHNIDQDHIKASDCWCSGAAQIFSEVSPEMLDEFEIEYMKPLYDRFGWVNYGCCDPLSRRVEKVKKFKTVRAMSASPWTNVDLQAEEMGSDYIMARKPNPSYVASGTVDEDSVRKEIRHTLEVCRNNNTPVMFILKDITTAGKRAGCLTDWCRIARSEIEKF